jgi:hypothetical protein
MLGEISLELDAFGFLHLRFRGLTVFKIIRYKSGRNPSKIVNMAL